MCLCSSVIISALSQLAVGPNGEEDGFKLWQSLVRQTELTAQLCSIMRDVRNVRGNTQKKIEKLRQLLSGLLSELTNIEEVFLQLEVIFHRSHHFRSTCSLFVISLQYLFQLYTAA